ncbi:MAG: MCE family protein [Marinospirillum sp.]|uniref:MlaD family protein n=1 Tax=Marinospirillum sp. TaxID=2183934 RepID=UPI0019D96D66|nr:MlaD family protein [Marinospirillum sp.]MBE0507764.1 MCE family protein [Marinospirillum sp.]
MNPRINYALVGGFVVLMLLSGLFFIGWLSQDSRNANRLPYITYFNDSVSGLNERAPVKYRGVPVGIVQRISLVTEPEERVRLDLLLDADVPIRSNTFATLQYQGITGLLFVELQSQDQTGYRLVSNPDQPAIIPSQSSRLVEVTENIDTAISGFAELVKSLHRVSEQLALLTDEQMQGQLMGTLAAVEQLSLTADKRLRAFDPKFYEQLAGQLPGYLDRLETRVSNQLENLGAQLQYLSEDTQAGTRQLGPLLQQAETLLEQIRQESHSWLRGNRKQTPGPGE